MSPPSKSTDGGSSHYWLAALLPALLYLLLSHHIHPSQHPRKRSIFGLGGRSYNVITSSLIIGDGANSPDVLAPGEIFYLDASSLAEQERDGGRILAKLVHPLEAVVGSPYKYPGGTTTSSAPQSSISTSTSDHVLRAVHSLAYQHDTELGRGYLLLSSLAHSGRIWRWEVGGGPITIGRSLHMDRSGCRSNLWTPGGQRCPPNDDIARSSFQEDDHRMGSAGITVEIVRDAESSRDGRLVVVERGERRIVRIEDDGSRTPLVLTVPDPCGRGANNSSTEGFMTRFSGTGRVLYGPFGDLIFTDTSWCDDDGSAASAVYVLREAVNVPPLPAPSSREAHGWTQIPTEGIHARGRGEAIVETLFDGMDAVADIAFGPGEEELYVAGMVDGAARIVKIALDDDADDDNSEEVTPRRGKRDKELAIGTASTTNMAKPFFDLSRKYNAVSSPSDAAFAIVIDNGGNVYASYPGGVVVIDSSGTEIASLALSSANTGSKNDNDKHTAAAVLPSDSLIIPTALEIGDDGYLYVSTSTSLMRIQSRIGPAVIGTDMVIPAKKKN